jgi:hypothetical protein
VTHLLCPAADCSPRNVHADGCENANCRGCMTRLAADGLRLCLVHTAKIGEDAVEAGRLHGELALVLAGTGRGGPRVSGGAIDKSLNLNEAAANARIEIRAKLVSWTKFISEKRGFSQPDGRVTDMAAFVATSNEWLAALSEDNLAVSASEELAELVQIARPVAYPSGTRRFSVGGCPECDADLMAVLRPGSTVLPDQVVCAEDPEHAWGREQWIALGVEVAAKRPVTVARERLRAGTVGLGGWQSRRAA